jgi:glycosyltransferase involved in cell wall biosynthesis
MKTTIVRRHLGDRDTAAIPIRVDNQNRNECSGSPKPYSEKNVKRSRRLRKNAMVRILLVFIFLFLLCFLGSSLRFQHSRKQAVKEHVDLRVEIPRKDEKKETDSIGFLTDRPTERKNGEKYSRSASSVLAQKKAKINERTSIGFNDWPLSRLDEIRKDPSKQAKLPASTSSLESIDCPQCASILAGAALHKRFLLLGHALSFCGGEIWLRDLGEMLEKSGAIVLFLFLSEDTPERTHLLPSHIEKGLSYRFWDSEGDSITFSEFDFVIANTAAVETWWHFYNTTSSYKSNVEMEELYRKTIFCIHEYNPRQFKDRFLNIVLQKVPKILFDSDAGKKKWLEILPDIASKSQTLHPGIPKKLMLPLMKVANDKEELQKKLEIPVTDSSDVVILQVSSIAKSKGIPNLIDAFQLMLETVGEEFIHERAWFLVLVGEGASRIIKKRIKAVNKNLTGKGTRSRILLRPATSEIANYYGASDIFVLNSKCENFGLVTVEAMLAGVPTISRDCGGTKEIVQHGVTGLLLPNQEQNKVELSKALLEMTTVGKWRQKLRKMGKMGKARAMKEFSYMRMARDFSNVIAEQRYFSEFDQKWTCSAQEEIKGEVFTYRSHSNDDSPEPPVLPVIKSYDIGCENVGSDLYIFGGYQDLNHVTKTMQFYDLKANVWVDAPALPKKAAESHVASTNDGRYFYSISGQLGAYVLHLSNPRLLTIQFRNSGYR